MQIAFNFTESAIAEIRQRADTALLLDATFPRIIARVIPAHRRHCRIQIGSVPTYHVPVTDRQNFGYAISQYPARWHSYLNINEFRRAVTSNDLCAVILDGISAEDATAIDELLHQEKCAGYLGAFQLLHGNNYHEALYFMSLPARYHIYASALSFLVSPDVEYGDGDFDDYLFNELRRLLPRHGITTVQVRGYGVTGTIFDPYETNIQLAETIGRIERTLDSYTEGIITEITLRARQSDPRLLEVLDAALELLQREGARESMSQVALSCRRFLERLADVVFPPRPTQEDEHKLGPAHYRNRLWAYVKEQLAAEGSDTAIKEIGARIDLLDRIANKGVHSDIGIDEVHRLVLNIALLTHDLLKLTPPSEEPSAFYAREQIEEMNKYVRWQSERGNTPQ